MDKRYWIIGAVIVLVIVVLGITLSSSKNISGKGSLASGGVFSKCSDSDGGLSYNVYGEVSSGSKKYQDACSGNILSEKYCKNNRPSSKDYNCPIVCYNGACCTPKTCSDLGKSCGTWDDGCGGTLNCGTCSSGQVCISGSCVASNLTSNVSG